MSVHEDFIASERFRDGGQAGDGVVRLALAGDVYAFSGLSDRQVSVALERFEEIAGPLDANDVNTIVTRVRSAPANAFLDRDTRGYDYRVALTYSEDRLFTSGLHFGADIERRGLTATLHTSLSDEYFIGAFENLFRVLAAYRLFERGAFVLHSAGFARASRGYLCFGRSGAGKTTICGLAASAGYRVVSDELNAIVPGSGHPRLLPMPFAGDYGRLGVDCMPADLVGLFALAQGPCTTRTSLSRTQAASRVIASCPYLNADPVTHDLLFDRILSFVAKFPIDLLTFAKTTDFCSLLDDQQPSQPVLRA